MHGLMQIVEKVIGQQKCKYGPWGRTIKIIITFLLVNFAWIFFRMPTLSDACGVIGRIFDFRLPFALYLPENTNLVLMAMGVTMLAAKDVLDEFYSEKKNFFDSRNWLVRWCSYVSVLMLILLTGVFGADQFIYANF